MRCTPRAARRRCPSCRRRRCSSSSASCSRRCSRRSSSCCRASAGAHRQRRPGWTMRRRPLVRALAGIVLLALACGAALLSRGVAAAEQKLPCAPGPTGSAGSSRSRPSAPEATAGGGREPARDSHAQRGPRRVPRLPPRARIDVEGAVFPQTQARWNAIATMSRLRGSLASARDRAGVDVTLGVVYAASAEAAGPTALRQRLQTNAVNAFRRGVLEHPTAHGGEARARDAADVRKGRGRRPGARAERPAERSAGQAHDDAAERACRHGLLMSSVPLSSLVFLHARREPGRAGVRRAPRRPAAAGAPQRARALGARPERPAAAPAAGARHRTGSRRRARRVSPPRSPRSAVSTAPA